MGAVWNAIAGNDAFVPGTSGGDGDWGREPAVRRGGAIFGGRTSGQRESAGENGVRRLLSARAWPGEKEENAVQTGVVVRQCGGSLVCFTIATTAQQHT